MPDIGKECRVRVTLPYRHADEINRRSEDDHRLRHDLIDDCSPLWSTPYRSARPDRTAADGATSPLAPAPRSRLASAQHAGYVLLSPVRVAS